MKYILFIFIAVLSACSPYGNLQKMEFEDIKYKFETKEAKIFDGNSIAYVDEGTGDRVIIFIHGLGSYLPAWNKNIEELSKTFRCIAIDLPGYGKSTKMLHEGSPEYYADAISSFMDSMGLKKAVVAGHSMGGQIAIVMSLKYPEKVESLVLAAPAGFEKFNEGQKQWFRDVLSPEAVALTPARTITENLYSNFYNMPDDAEFMITDRIALRGAKDFKNYCYTVSQSVKGMVNQTVIDFLENITQPVLIVFGENDNLIPNPYLTGGFTKDIAEIGHTKIKNSKLVMIPECGHFLQYEKSIIFNNSVLEFLKQN